MTRPLTRRFAAPSPRVAGRGETRCPSPRLRGEGGRRPDEGRVIPIKILRALAIVVIASVFLPQLALACPVCYGESDSALQKGMNNGILALLSIVGFVQIGFIALFWSFWKRSKRLERGGAG